MSIQKILSREAAPERDEYHEPKSVTELTARNVEVVARLDEAAKAKRTSADRVVDGITAFCGRLSFVWVHVVFYGFWIVYNEIRGRRGFDPPPFQLLAMTVSLEAIFLSTFILISQNRQNRLAERRNHLDLQINLLSEQESTKMLTMLSAIVKHLNIQEGAPEVGVLAEATQPEMLVDQIERLIEKEEGSPKSSHVNEP